jgi:branched-chain amino acid aminotransferase
MIPEPADNLIVFFNDRFVPASEARISLLTHALHYGTGVFDGIRGYWCERQREVFLLRPEDHFRRWIRNSALLRMDLAHTVDELVDLTTELIRHNQLRSDLYVRPIAYHSCRRIGVQPDGQYALALIAVPFGDYLPSAEGVRAGVASWRRIEDTAIPARAKICGAYVNSMLAGDEARRHGYDEAILLNEDGHVAEGATCNLFIVRRGKLVTPGPSENILEGVTRDCVIELARRELHLEIEERRVDRSELYLADEAFFTGTAVEVAPIVEVDHHPVGDGRIGPITSELRQIYLDAAHNRMTGYRHWLHSVYQGVLTNLSA